jgi:two-component system, chemotaxis family, chemotaxis protein CheY
MNQIVFPDLRVVVIEDEVYTRTIIVRGLRQLGIVKVHEAKEGGEGLKVVATVRPNLILCDVHMEPVGGLRFLEDLRKLPVPAIAAIPVVFLTADSEEGTVLAARNLRVDGYLVKPISITQLRKRIEAVLGG